MPRVRVNIAPGVAELFSIPSYTHSGPCDIMLVESAYPAAKMRPVRLD